MNCQNQQQKKLDRNELKLKVYQYLDEGFFPEDVAEILDISESQVRAIIKEVEGG